MKYFKNKSEFFHDILLPDGSPEHLQNLNAFNVYTQEQFNRHLVTLGAEEGGSISSEEISTIRDIKESIVKMRKEFSDKDKERLEFDLAIIFHSHLKKLKWGRSTLNEYSMWRWLSMNYFLKEVFWRRGEDKMREQLIVEAAKATYNHLVGTRPRDIFPRRYFLLGERLFDDERGYDLLKKLASLSRRYKSGGFGNLVLNLIDTRLLSPRDHVAKTISTVLFAEGKLAEDKEVARAFARYNGFKRRLLNTASDEIFKHEICIG